MKRSLCAFALLFVIQTSIAQKKIILKLTGIHPEIEKHIIPGDVIPWFWTQQRHAPAVKDGSGETGHSTLEKFAR